MVNKPRKKDSDNKYEIPFKESNLLSVNPYDFLNVFPSKLCTKAGIALFCCPKTVLK